ncbi:hypothetical protein EPN15_05370 [Patescibacteria group bacterium]|nr:MAG: hypothetical protein EPN15_05370 [Patescibacteria group bacterium]
MIKLIWRLAGNLLRKNYVIKIIRTFMPIASELQFAPINTSRLNEKQKAILLEEIDILLKNAWGKFERDFLENHIFTSEQITVARIGNEYKYAKILA